MKTGRSLESLVNEVDRRQRSKRDYVANSNQLEVIHQFGGDQAVALSGLDAGRGAVSLRPHAHSQLSAKTGIPKKYYDRMLKTAPDLLVENLNHWFHNQPKRLMVRTLDDKVRAILSDRYRRIDNFDVLAYVLPILREARGDMVIASCEITESRMYVKATFPTMRREIKVGDVVEGGLCFGNSETGQGQFSVFPWLRRRVCDNGMTVADGGVQRRHVGSHLGSEGTGVEELYTDTTLEADDRALMLKMADVVRATVTEESFDKVIGIAARSAVEYQIHGDPAKVVERLQDRYSMTDEERGTVLRNLITGQDTSAWGLANAVTAMAGETENYDRASDFESAGGDIISLDREDWMRLAA